MNNTPPVPLGSAFANGEQAFQWLGNLWTRIFRDASVVRNLMAGEGILQAQTYLNYLEALNLVDRKNVPVFHRERWRLIVLRLSQRNTGAAAALQLGLEDPPVIGPQTEAPYVVGTVFTIGGYTTQLGITTYPVGYAGLKDVVTALADSIAGPTKVLIRDVDFRIENETILFLNGNDPFEIGFPTRTVDNGDGTTDTEVGVWASDVMIDRDYPWNYAGYVLGVRDTASEFYMRYLNALWDMYNGGGTLKLFQSGIAALLDEPVTLEDEAVQLISASPLQVVTDKRVYTPTTGASLNPDVVVGAVLPAGTIITDSVRVHDNLKPSSDEDLLQLQTDTAALFLPAGFFRAKLSYGLGLSWQMSPITYEGADANGNPKLRFTVYGDPVDIEAFWQDFWGYCERRNIDPRTCFEGHLHATVFPVEGSVWGQVSVVEYFLNNLLQANLLLVAVDMDKLSAQGRSKLGLLATMKRLLPARVCLFVVERQTLTPESYDLGVTPTDAATPAIAVACSDEAGAGVYARVKMSYGDSRPRVLLLPVCPGV